MAFANVSTKEIQVSVHRNRIEGLLELLPEADSKALLDILANPRIPIDNVWEIINSQAEDYPDINEKYFNMSRETVRRFARNLRKESVEVRGN